MKMEECCGNCYWNMITKAGIICLHMDSTCCGELVMPNNICPEFAEWPMSTEEVGYYAKQTDTSAAHC